MIPVGHFWCLFGVNYAHRKMSKLSSDYLSSFEELIDTYAQIATFPRFDRLSTAFKNESRFQELLALFYADILEFHRRAYKFFRSRGVNSHYSSAISMCLTGDFSLATLL